MKYRIIKIGIVYFSNWLTLSIAYAITKDPFIAWANNTQIVDYGVETNFIYCSVLCLFLYLLFSIFKLMYNFKSSNILLSALYFAAICYVLCFIIGIFIGNARPSIVWKPVLPIFILGFLLPLGHRFWEKLLSKKK